MVPPSPMRIVFMALRHFVISSIARFFSEGTSRREMLSRTVRTRSCGVFGRLERLKRKDMSGLAHSAIRQTAQTAEDGQAARRAALEGARALSKSRGRLIGTLGAEERGWDGGDDGDDAAQRRGGVGSCV
jgi:hypothetical protein